MRRCLLYVDDDDDDDLSLYFRPYLEAVFHALECTENDYEALFALCLLYAMGHNDGKRFDYRQH